jgi:hypothetical protein
MEIKENQTIPHFAGYFRYFFRRQRRKILFFLPLFLLIALFVSSNSFVLFDEYISVLIVAFKLSQSDL